MFPEKIRRFVVELVQRTEAGQLPWRYDYFDAVYCRADDFSAKLLYSMNTRDSCMQFVFIYRDSEENDYDFCVRNDEKDPCDFDLAQQLFDTARVSRLSLPYAQA